MVRKLTNEENEKLQDLPIKLENQKNQKLTGQDLECGKKHGKMRKAHCRTWYMSGNTENMENENAHYRTCYMRESHCKTW